MPFTIRWDNGGPVYTYTRVGDKAYMRRLVDELFEMGQGYTTVMAIADGYEYGRMAWR
jgi:hypothetical protein